MTHAGRQWYIKWSSFIISVQFLKFNYPQKLVDFDEKHTFQIRISYYSLCCGTAVLIKAQNEMSLLIIIMGAYIPCDLWNNIRNYVCLDDSQFNTMVLSNHQYKYICIVKLFHIYLQNDFIWNVNNLYFENKLIAAHIQMGTVQNKTPTTSLLITFSFYLMALIVWLKYYSNSTRWFY